MTTKPGTKVARMVQLAKRPGGVSTREAMTDLGICGAYAASGLQDLRERKEVFMGGQRRPYRYFGSAQEAAAYRSPPLKDPSDKRGSSWRRNTAACVMPVQKGPLDVLELQRSGVKVTIARTCADTRFTVQELPPGYRSQLDPGQARQWAKAVA